MCHVTNKNSLCCLVLSAAKLGTLSRLQSFRQGVSRLSDAPQHPDLALSRHDTEVLLQHTPVRDPGVDFYLPDVISLRKSQLLSVLQSMGQTVSKQAPTRLELLGVTVTLLCSLGRLSV